MKPLRKIKKKVIIPGIAVLVILIIVAAFFLHLLPSLGSLNHMLEPKASAVMIPSIDDASGVLSTPLEKPLIAEFSAAPVDRYTPLNLQFLDLSRGDPISWQWDFGDNSSSQLQHPVHAYSQNGLYNVSLTVTRNDGAQVTTSRQDILSVQKNPEQMVILDSLRQGVLKKGSAISLVTGNSESYVTVDANRVPLPNGSVIEMRTGSDGPGMITIRNGNIMQFASDDTMVYVNGLQVARGKSGDCSLTGYRDSAINISFSVLPLMGEVRQIVINGEKVRAGAENSHIAISEEGSDIRHDLTLVSSPAYYEGSATGISFSQALVADFLPAPVIEGEAPVNVTFFDDSAGYPKTWFWDFGDGMTSRDKNPTHTYQGTGSYTVKLTVTAGDQEDTTTHENAVVVNPPHIAANFSAAPLAGPAPLRVTFTDHSSGSPWAWNWSFGVNATPSGSSDQNAVVVYTVPGTYTVWLSVANIYGSSDLIRPQYITVTDPYRFPDKDILVKTGKWGYIQKDSSIRFTIKDIPATIGINGGSRQIPKGSIVRIVANSDQQGNIYIDNSKLLKFSFPDMALYIDDQLVAVGPIDSIYIPYLAQFDTSLSYYLVPNTAYTFETINGYQVLADLDNARIQIHSLGMNEKGSLSLIATANSTYIDGAANETINDWVIE